MLFFHLRQLISDDIPVNCYCATSLTDLAFGHGSVQERVLLSLASLPGVHFEAVEPVIARPRVATAQPFGV